MEISMGQLVAIMAATFGVTTTVVGVLVKQILKTNAERSIQALKNVRDSCVADVRQISERVAAVAEDRQQCEVREDREMQRITLNVERLRDKWEKFVRDDAAMEATRGRKVEALFGVVDSIKATVHDLPSTINNRIDELSREIRHELKNDIREEIYREKKKGREV